MKLTVRDTSKPSKSKPTTYTTFLEVEVVKTWHLIVKPSAEAGFSWQHQLSCGVMWDLGYCLHTAVSSLMHNKAFLHSSLTLLLHHYNSSHELTRFAARRFNQHQCQQHESSALIVKVCVMVSIHEGLYANAAVRQLKPVLYWKPGTRGKWREGTNNDRFIITDSSIQLFSVATVWGRQSGCYFCWSGLQHISGSHYTRPKNTETHRYACSLSLSVICADVADTQNRVLTLKFLRKLWHK